MSDTREDRLFRRLFGRQIARRDLLRGMVAGLGVAGVTAKFGYSSALAATTGKVVNSIGKEMPADAAPLGQQVLRMMGRDTKYYDIGYSQYDSSWPQEMIFEPLGRLTKDHNAVPGAAERWESSDGKTWRFY
jgi:ABC-type transport system substrate-binding protein